MFLRGSTCPGRGSNAAQSQAVESAVFAEGAFVAMVPRQQETQREDPVCRCPLLWKIFMGEESPGKNQGPTPAPGEPEEEESPGHGLRQAE